MNAHVATPEVSPTALALAHGNAALLRHMVDHSPIGAPAEAARAIGLDTKNIGRTFANLEREGLIHFVLPDDPAPDDLGVYEVTAAGYLALRAADVAGGRASDADAANDVLMLRHDRIVRNPLNARKLDLTDEKQRRELDELKAQIVSVDDVLQNLVVFPPDLAGTHQLFAGERRWTAVGELIAEGLWAADRPLRAIQRAATPGQTAFISLVENSQVALSTLERARAYATLCEDTGWSAREAALRTGWDVKSVQQYLQVLKKADPAHLAAHEAGDPDWMWEDLRKSVQEPKAAEEPEPEQGDLEEVIQKPGPTNGLESLFTLARVALNRYDQALVVGNTEAARDAAGAYDTIVVAVNGGPHFGSAVSEGEQPSAQDVVGEACAAPVGEVPKWGQYGRFVLDIDGMKVGVVCDRGPSKFTPGGEANTYAVDPDAPFFSNTGYRSEMGLRGGRVFAHALVARLCWLMSNKENRAGPIDPMFRDREDAAQFDGLPVFQVPESWTRVDDPLVVDGVRYKTPALAKKASEAAQVKAPIIGGGASQGVPAPKPAVVQRPLTPIEVLALLELAHATLRAVREGRDHGGGWTRAGKYWLDTAFSDLQALGLIAVSHQHGPGHVGLLALGRQRLGDHVEGFDPTEVTDDQLEAAREAAVPGFTGGYGGPAYLTPWLNVETTPSPAAGAPPTDAPAPTDILDDEFTEARAVLVDVGRRLWSGEDDPNPTEILKRCGLTFPLTYDATEAAIVDFNREPVFEMTGHGDIAEDLLKARAMMLITALNEAVMGWMRRPAISRSGQPAPAPAVPVRRSITPDDLVCLEDGGRFMALGRHLWSTYGLTREAYLERWKLPKDYPLIAPNEAHRRDKLLTIMGLGWDDLQPADEDDANDGEA